MRKLPELADVLRYENTSVLERYCFENPGKSSEQAREIFQDMLRWLWLSVSRAERQLTTHMIAPLTHLDNMWHIFILHTKNYSDFCEKYFNEYLHHEVEPVGKEFVMGTDELSAFLGDCYDCLGEGWLLRNFE